MYSENKNDGIFVYGVEIYCDPETYIPIHVVGDQIWVVVFKDAKKRWKYHRD